MRKWPSVPQSKFLRQGKVIRTCSGPYPRSPESSLAIARDLAVANPIRLCFLAAPAKVSGRWSRRGTRPQTPPSSCSRSFLRASKGAGSGSCRRPATLVLALAVLYSSREPSPAAAESVLHTVSNRPGLRWDHKCPVQFLQPSRPAVRARTRDSSSARPGKEKRIARLRALLQVLTPVVAQTRGWDSVHPERLACCRRPRSRRAPPWNECAPPPSSRMLATSRRDTALRQTPTCGKATCESASTPAPRVKTRRVEPGRCLLAAEDRACEAATFER